MRKRVFQSGAGLAVAALVWTGVSAQEPAGGAAPPGAGSEAANEARVERLIRVLGDAQVQIGVSIADLESGASHRGARVDDVREESPAARAGIRKGDVITEFDGERVRSARQLSRLVSETPAGRTVQVSVTRDGQPLALQVTPEQAERRLGFHDGGRGFGLGRFQGPVLPPRLDPPDPEQRREWFERFHPYGGEPPAAPRGRLGLVVQPLSSQLAEYFGTEQGVLVASVRDGSPAANAGLRAGDVITALNGRTVRVPEDVARASAEGGELTIVFVRDRRSQEVTVTLPAPERSPERMRPV